MSKAVITFHSVCGNCLLLAELFKSSLEACGSDASIMKVDDHDAKQWQQQYPAAAEYAEKLDTIPVATPEALLEADLVILGSPTYFGNMSGEMKLFLDQTAPFFLEHKLAGKGLGCFTSASSQEGGGALCLQSLVHFGQHMGMIHVPTPMVAQQTGRSVSGYGIIHHSSFDGSSRPDENISAAISKYCSHICRCLKLND